MFDPSEELEQGRIAINKNDLANLCHIARWKLHNAHFTMLHEPEFTMKSYILRQRYSKSRGFNDKASVPKPLADPILLPEPQA